MIRADIKAFLLNDSRNYSCVTLLATAPCLVAIINMSATLKHPALGEIKGNQRDGVAQFLGLKYASIKDRFAPPELAGSYGPGNTDATKFGYVQHTFPPPNSC